MILRQQRCCHALLSGYSADERRLPSALDISPLYARRLVAPQRVRVCCTRVILECAVLDKIIRYEHADAALTP